MVAREMSYSIVTSSGGFTHGMFEETVTAACSKAIKRGEETSSPYKIVVNREVDKVTLLEIQQKSVERCIKSLYDKDAGAVDIAFNQMSDIKNEQYPYYANFMCDKLVLVRQWFETAEDVCHAASNLGQFAWCDYAEAQRCSDEETLLSVSSDENSICILEDDPDYPTAEKFLE